MSLWENIVIFLICLVVFSFIMGFIDVAVEQRRNKKEREEREKWQLKSKEAADSEK